MSVVVITGGSRGIGAATARRAAAAGWDVCLSYVSNRVAGEQVAAACRAGGRSASAVRADITSEVSSRPLGGTWWRPSTQNRVVLLGSSSMFCAKTLKP